MKKIFIYGLIVTLAAGLYLYLANSYAYYLMGKAELTAPASQVTYAFSGDKDGVKNLNYVALGDSLTAGMGLADFSQSFPYLLAEKLADNHQVVLTPLAVPGYRTDDLADDLLDWAIAAQPDIITLLIGTNDVHGFYGQGKFKANYEAILKRLTQGTKAKICLVSLPFIGVDVFFPPYENYFSRQTAEFNKIIQELAAAYGVKYIDIAGPTKDLLAQPGPYYGPDNFHPSAAGQALWAQIIFDSLKGEWSAE